MKHLLIALLFVFLGYGKTNGEELPDRDIRVMSYNIRNGIGMDGKMDFQRIADVIGKASPDIVALQEIDSMTNRSGQHDVLVEVAKRTAMYPMFAKAIDYDGGKYGIGILSKEKPLRSFRYSLPGREEKRTMLVVEFNQYVYCNVHLSLAEEDQAASLDMIKKATSSFDKPVLMAGDMNATPGSPFLQALQKDFRVISSLKEYTSPADEPKELIDYILTRTQDTARLYVKDARVLPEAVASDHRPVLVDLMWKQPANQIFRTNPYLQNPVGNGITVMWQTTVPTYSWVEYGTDKTHLKRARTLLDGQVVCDGLQNKIRLNDLTPGKTYYYRICSREILDNRAYLKVFGETAVSDFYTFTLPTETQEDFTAIIFNDLHKHSETLQALYKQVKDVPYDFVVFNGDCIDDPMSHAEATHFLKELNNTVGAHQVPVFYLRGNHEIRGAFSIGLHYMFDYVGDKTYSAFNWGDTRFVILDCGEDKPDSTAVYYDLNDFSQLRKDQRVFLEKELKSKAFKKAQKRVLLHHAPVYGLVVDYTTYNPCLEMWGDLLSKAPFDICLNAHTHKYAYHPKGSIGNNYPVVIGGSYDMEGATVMVLQKKGDQMNLKVLNTKGEVILKLAL